MTDKPKKLSDTDIETVQKPGRRRALGLLTLGSAAAGAAVMQGQEAHAQAADIDNGTWTDLGSCPRGFTGAYTGVTDADDGAIIDQGGYGRGAPYC